MCIERGRRRERERRRDTSVRGRMTSTVVGREGGRSGRGRELEEEGDRQKDNLDTLLALEGSCKVNFAK